MNQNQYFPLLQIFNLKKKLNSLDEIREGAKAFHDVLECDLPKLVKEKPMETTPKAPELCHRCGRDLYGSSQELFSWEWNILQILEWNGINKGIEWNGMESVVIFHHHVCRTELNFYIYICKHNIDDFNFTRGYLDYN